MNKNELCRTIANIIKDYRKGEVEPITSFHVEKWVSQFNSNDQLIILEEMEHVLNKHYFSRETVKKILKNFLIDPKISGNISYRGILQLNFLKIQKEGNSQKDMLLLVDEILQEEYGFFIDECGGSDIYVYIDDGVFTGTKFLHNLVSWIKEAAPNRCKIITFHLVHHSQGRDYAIKHIKEEARRKEIEIYDLSYKVLKNYKKNSYLPYLPIQTLWPQKIIGDTDISNYHGKIKDALIRKGSMEYDNLFRCNEIINEALFKKRENRDVVERSFLQKGVKLILGLQKAVPYIRPLGFEKLESFGFGTFFITYRNVANNCPLVLWYTIGNWIPLFQRKYNETNNNIESTRFKDFKTGETLSLFDDNFFVED